MITSLVTSPPAWPPYRCDPACRVAGRPLPDRPVSRNWNGLTPGSDPRGRWEEQG